MRIILGIIIVFFLVLYVRAVIDVFRRHDLSAGGRAAWVIALLVFPFIGLLVYTLLRPAGAGVRG
jgi:hypothetical protein